MDTGQIQLGVKKGSGKFLDRYPSQGFFYWRWRKLKFSAVIAGCRYHTVEKQTSESKAIKSNALNPARQHLIFYDNPNRKRLARCTNIPHKGAILSDMGVERLLRKGFWKRWRGSQDRRGWKSSDPTKSVGQLKTAFSAEICGATIAVPTARSESLSSAAKIRHPARNKRLR